MTTLGKEFLKTEVLTPYRPGQPVCGSRRATRTISCAKIYYHRSGTWAAVGAVGRLLQSKVRNSDHYLATLSMWHRYASETVSDSHHAHYSHISALEVGLSHANAWITGGASGTDTFCPWRDISSRER